jgi:hypothetical protein
VFLLHFFLKSVFAKSVFLKVLYINASTDTQFCGTHIKGQPYGIETKQDKTKQQMKKIEIWVQDIKGINYYIDSSNNVYKPEDIIANLPN